MNANTWITLGIIAGAFSLYALQHGSHLKSEENTKKIIAELRKTATERTTSNQIAIFKQINNNFVFQSTKPEHNPSSAPISTKKEVKIIFSLPTFEINTSYNVLAIVDNGLGDVSIVFDEDFPDKNYYVNITGDKTINYKKIIKEKGSLRIKFEEENLKMVQVICTES